MLLHSVSTSLRKFILQMKYLYSIYDQFQSLHSIKDSLGISLQFIEYNHFRDAFNVEIKITVEIISVNVSL